MIDMQIIWKDAIAVYYGTVVLLIVAVFAMGVLWAPVGSLICGLGPVHTKGSGHVIIHVWNLHKLITNSSNRTYPCSVAMVTIPNIRVLNAILYVAEHGCKWRGLPSRFGNWHTIYMRMNRWTKSGVLDRVFEQPRKGIVKVTGP